MPALNPKITKLEDVAEPLRTFYEAKDGAFHLILSEAPTGFVPAADLATANGKVVEFRDANIELKKKVDKLEPLAAKFEGIDPDEAKTALAEAKKLKDKGVKTADDLQTTIQAAVAAGMKPLQDELAAIKTTNSETVKRNQELTLRTTLGEKFTKAGGVPEALDFMLGRAKDVFVVGADGKVTAAPNQFSATKPGEPLGLDEWLTRQTKEQAFAFKPSGGGGADPARGGGGSGGGTFTGRIIKDPTPQQLGDAVLAKGIKDGTVKFEYTQTEPAGS